VGLWQFGTLDMALTVGAVSTLIFCCEGSLLSPWLSSKASRMSPVVIFVGVLAWGWLWGIWGLFLGVPVLMIVKSVCDHVEDLQPIGELMSAEDAQDL
jgi:predicted PurR-regulated permease PerM